MLVHRYRTTKHLPQNTLIFLVINLSGSKLRHQLHRTYHTIFNTILTGSSNQNIYIKKQTNFAKHLTASSNYLTSRSLKCQLTLPQDRGDRPPYIWLLRSAGRKGPTQWQDIKTRQLANKQKTAGKQIHKTIHLFTNTLDFTKLWTYKLFMKLWT